ncbi:MAG TPA: hypothetical protein VFY87_18760 [Geminicoccaceae bacterium]|nr:hypothetical protein [Geminicoccaceae bacterium]
MDDRAFEQVGHGREADVRVRSHVQALAGEQLHRPELVEEDERAHHLPFRRGQGVVDLEPAQVAGARDDHGLDRVAGRGGAQLGRQRGLPAHPRVSASVLTTAASLRAGQVANPA